jgi:chaperone BCS1
MCEKKTLKIFTISYESMYGNLTDLWTSSNLDHPATFATLAMNLEILRGL